MLRRAVFLLASSALCSCADQRHPQRIVATTNPDYQIAKLFEVDGCSVYRFWDEYHHRYFSSCPNSSVGSLDGCGRNCHVDTTISTSDSSFTSAGAGLAR